MELNELKKQELAPDWLSEESLVTLSGGYLLPSETPREMYRRVSESVAKHLKRPDLADKFYRYIDNNWLCLSTPVASNAGTARGLNISCFGSYVPDSIDGIFKSYHEAAMLTKYGGGTSSYWGGLRDKGALISDNGYTDGIIPWLKVREATISSTAQGGVRRGVSAEYYPIMGKESEVFIDIRREHGDLNLKCLSKAFHHGVCINDEFMSKVISDKGKERSLWLKVLNTRLETGEPFLFWSDTVNRNKPQWFKDQNRTIYASNVCNEIMLPSDEEHTFVCCLSSLNAARYDEWKDTDLVETAIYFLDGVLSEFISKAQTIPGFEKAVRFAEKSRALGLGVLGWHTYLQTKMIPFESWKAMEINNILFKQIRNQADIATRKLALEYGEPEWCKEYGIRNSTLMACAPTISNSLISGGLSQGIEPIKDNYHAQDTAKGTFIRKNPILVNLLQEKNKNFPDIWDVINACGGSVQRLPFLTLDEKEVFKTAVEINQFSIIKQAAQRQQYIDQGQSVNLFFNAPESLDLENKQKLAKYINQVHLEAYNLGLKGLYYLKAMSVLGGDSNYRDLNDCDSCGG
jgi:ribonucleoside-diphosphate reductase alpha chain